MGSASGNLEGILNGGEISLGHIANGGATNYALRRPRTTIATKYDYDDSSRGLASIGAFVKIMINTSYDYHELLIRRTMSTMEYDYDDDSTTTATFCSYIVGGGRLRKCTFARFGHAVRRDNRARGKTN